MKKLIFIIIISSGVSFYAADKGEPAKKVEPQRLPTAIKSRTKPDKTEPTASKYSWYQVAASGDWVGFLEVKYWDNALKDSKLSKRMSVEDYSQKPE